MKLRDVRKLGIKYCEENNCNYTYISHDNSDGFYLMDKEDSHTVFRVGRNGSLNAYYDTSYAIDFYKELKRRKRNRRKNDKRIAAEVVNRDLVNPDLAEE